MAHTVLEEPRRMRLSSRVVFALAALVAACGSSENQASTSADEFNDGLSPELITAAKANLTRVAREIDGNHMATYGMDGDLASQFVRAARTEYAANLPLLKRRIETLASMVFFSAPDVATNPSVGRMTPFHGMDEAAFNALMANEDFVFGDHMKQNGNKPNGVRPFSVCETKYLIDISKGLVENPEFVTQRKITKYLPYARAYAQYAASCQEKDLDEWYNFRGLGGLRPTWLESNLSDRFLRRQVKACKAGVTSGDCNAWNADRIGYRDRKNTELALRTMVYDPDPALRIGDRDISFEAWMNDPRNGGVFVEDRDGDGVGEWIAPGPLSLRPGAKVTFSTGTPIRLPRDVEVTLASAIDVSGQTLPAGTKVTIKSGGRIATDAKIENDTTAHAPIAFAANAKLRLTGPASLVLEDGTSISLPSQGDNAKTARLTAELSLSVAEDAPLLMIGKPRGMFSGNQFVGELQAQVKLAGGTDVLIGSVNAADVEAHAKVDPSWKKEYLERKDLGLLTVFPSATGCEATAPDPKRCGLLRRFYSLIDRHENFYQTYSSMAGASSIISQQPSPLVACSVTLRASHDWDDAGTPPGGRAGFIYLMRIPFSAILTGDARSIDTLGRLKDANGDGVPDEDLRAGPKVTTVESLYRGATLEMDKVWLDIATLSNNQYAAEHEVSKFGSVPAEQIEGILVVRLPAAMTDGADPGQGVQHEAIDEEDVYYDHQQ
jgi:hypothetical protein